LAAGKDFILNATPVVFDCSKEGGEVFVRRSGIFLASISQVFRGFAS
jgi:hypothetical protein